VAPDTTNLAERAGEDLRFIRDAMARGSAFTCVPGLGGILMGAVGVAAAVLAPRAGTGHAWLAVWVGAAFLAFAVGVVALLRKARREAHRPAGSAARRFTLALLPPLVAGAALTAALASRETYAVLPAIWLMLYGCGVVAAGTMTIRPVGVMGALFVALGVLTLQLPLAFANLALGAGFGALHIVFGIVIGRMKHEH